MWAVITNDGQVIEEGQYLWPDLPKDIKIKKLLWRDQSGAVGGLNGFDFYGFQRCGFSTPVSNIVSGAELIGIKDDEVTIVKINERTGEKTKRQLSRSELTYNTGLIRDGVGG